jgi:hypothetical protein
VEWNAYIDLYCERLIPGFWAEPLNALSNAAFWLAAWAVWRLWGKRKANNHNQLTSSGNPSTSNFHTQPKPDVRWDIYALLIMLVLIGSGSFVFHTLATRWASAVDVLCIALYLHFYLAVYAHRSLGLHWRWAAATFVQTLVHSSRVFRSQLNFAPA